MEDDSELIYYAMPDDEEMRRPINIELDKENNEEFVVVTWKKPTDYDLLKRYEVNDHIVYVGCDDSNTIIKNGQMKCEQKDLYVTLHPVEEWVKNHIIER